VIKTELYNFLTIQSLGVVSYSSSNSTPQSALVAFAVNPELELVFDTVQSSRKYPSLVAKPACSFVIGWQGETTVQYEGIAQELTGADLDKYKKVYFARFADAPERQSWPGIAYFVVRPKWIRFSDYDQQPPRIEEIRWP
jgi:pyridoxine/pyridoxamine 5'-phosphate oxidase